MNLETLESRLSDFLRQATMNNHRNQQYPQLVSSSPIGTMIPTPGMSHGPNSSVVVASSIDSSMVSSSGGNSVVSTTFNGVNMLPTGGIHGSSLNRSDGNKMLQCLTNLFTFVFLFFILKPIYCRFIKWISAVFYQLFCWLSGEHVINECAENFKPDDSYAGIYSQQQSLTYEYRFIY